MSLWRSWLPWRHIVRRAARSHGLIDPLAFVARLRRFARPSEVQEPFELIRAGVMFHARGLVNTKVFQYNLDWIWPYWVSRQFDPLDVSFLPRAFSFSHVNLTHRNWTAVGLPGMEYYPVVDPRGMVTLPEPESWSLDWWFLPEEPGAPPLFPSRTLQCRQSLSFAQGLEVTTESGPDDCRLVSRARVAPGRYGEEAPHLVIDAAVRTKRPGRLLLTVRPVNPEGYQEITSIDFAEQAMVVNGVTRITLHAAPEMYCFSNHSHGDLLDHLDQACAAGSHHVCPAGLATGGAVFRLNGPTESISATLPIRTFASEESGGPENRHPSRRRRQRNGSAAPQEVETWPDALAGVPNFQCPDQRWTFLHQAALRTLILLAPLEVVPGPFTYRRFWFRDACLMMNALLAANQFARVRGAIELFRERQRADGFFHSQEGEWDSNGQVLWIADRYERMSGRLLGATTMGSLRHGAFWISRKRIADPASRGLMPPGFSAEHLGPVDHYYWDNFWGVAGLRAATTLARRRGDAQAATMYQTAGDEFAAAIRSSLEDLPDAVKQRGIPASPGRRMDSGAIGSLVVDYPLQLDEFGPERFLRTADWLVRRCCVTGGFFQDMIHSGTNAYLTLALAQTLLRHGDPRHERLITKTAELASPTGQWPEAIHPGTGGGCMGDGQHGWAAAEWMLAMRALFIREENDHLVVGAGLPESWFDSSSEFYYGPTATRWGAVTVRLSPRSRGWHLVINGTWNGQPPNVVVAIPGFRSMRFAHLPPAVVLEAA